MGSNIRNRGAGKIGKPFLKNGLRQDRGYLGQGFYMYFRQTESSDEQKSQRIHDGDGFIKRRNLFGSFSNLPIQIEIWELDEGVSEGDHIHGDARPLEEIYYFLEGSGEMTIEGEKVLVEKNDALMVPPKVDHGIRNTGTGPLKMMIVWGISSE